MKLHELPVDIMVALLRLSEAATLFRLQTTCSGMRDLLDPRACPGREIWRDVRIRIGAPDPRPIGMSDMRLLSILNQRGCNGCKEHPRMQTVFWEFHGIRLCRACFVLHTSVGMRGCNRRYLCADLRRRTSFHTATLKAIHDFRLSMQRFHNAIMEARMEAAELARSKRREAIDAYLCIHMLGCDVSSWSNTAAYRNACRKTHPLTDLAAHRLLNRVRRSLLASQRPEASL